MDFSYLESQTYGFWIFCQTLRLLVIVGKTNLANLDASALFYCITYSRVHISLDEVFSKILKKPSIDAEKNDTS